MATAIASLVNHSGSNASIGSCIWPQHQQCSHKKLAILWQVDHICKVRNCVNPEHLQLLSQRDHYEKDVLAAILRKARFCRKGHERDVHGTNAKGVCNQCAKDRRAMKKFREHIFKDTWGT
jgi:hypothetical protein